jgi:hypothetical protein
MLAPGTGFFLPHFVSLWCRGDGLGEMPSLGNPQLFADFFPFSAPRAAEARSFRVYVTLANEFENHFH